MENVVSRVGIVSCLVLARDRSAVEKITGNILSTCGRFAGTSLFCLSAVGSAEDQMIESNDFS